MFSTVIIHCNCRRRPLGFTLTELLLSLAVSLLLAVVLVSLGSSIMGHARKTGCVNNLRNQLVGLLAFSSDHGKRYYWPAADTAADNAPEHLYPDYVGSLELFVCPATKNRIRLEVVNAKTGKPADLKNNAAHAMDSRGGHSYEYFGFYSIPADEVRLEWIGDKFYARKRPNHPYKPPHETVLVVDGDDFGINNFPDKWNNHGTAGWHWGFADGHVRWIPATETSRFGKNDPE
jgi:prepilin-type N-terminal cleavage/methylation domain-containing protein